METDGKEAEGRAAEELAKISNAIVAYRLQEQSRHEKSDKHDRKIRRWTRTGVIGALVYTFLTTGILAGTVYGLYLTTIQLELAERPWVQANITLVGPLTFDAEGGHLSIRFGIKNTGHSPAINVVSNVEVDVAKDNTIPAILAKAESLCSNVITGIDPERQLGVTTFPDAPQSNSAYHLVLKQADIEAEQKISPFKPGIIFRIYSCTKYRLTFASKTHQSSYIYEVEQRGGPNGYRLIVPTAGASVPPAELLLLTDPHTPARTD